jgi:hypothetical protein
MSQINEAVNRWIAQRTGMPISGGALSLQAVTDSLHRIERNLLTLTDKSAYDVLFYSPRKEFFDSSEIESLSAGFVRSVTFCGEETQLSSLGRRFDLIIACTHLLREHFAHLIMRTLSLAPLLVAWTWDNHHQPFSNLCYTTLADIVLPGHKFCADILKSPRYLLGRHIPLCTAQWPLSVAGKLLASENFSSRSDALYGGYILYHEFHRKEQLAVLREGVPGNHLTLLDDKDRDQYFGLPADVRFRDWASHKVSLAITLSHDLSLRVFDALLAGQIPIVAGTCHDLDAVISPHQQELLPVLRAPDISVRSVTAAWQEGVVRFDAAGQEGVRRRHEFARDHHHITSRIQQIATFVAGLAGRFDEVDLSIDARGLGLVIA